MAAAGALLLAACVHVAGPRTAVAAPAVAIAATEDRLYVVRRGWHIDIGIEAEAAVGPVADLRTQFPRVRYLLFGFGDRRYLQSHHRAPALLAALWPGEGLILVTALSGSPAQAFGEDSVVALDVSAAQLAAAIARVNESLLLRDGALQSDGSGPYDGSLYLRASQRYSAVHTCNTWAAQVLEAGGVAVHSRRVLFAAQLWRQLHPRPVAAAGHRDAAAAQP
jgi:hypothetical protein